MLLKHFMWEQDEYKHFMIEEKTSAGQYKTIWEGCGLNYEDQYGNRRIMDYSVFEDYTLVTLEDNIDG